MKMRVWRKPGTHKTPKSSNQTPSISPIISITGLFIVIGILVYFFIWLYLVFSYNVFSFTDLSLI